MSNDVVIDRLCGSEVIVAIAPTEELEDDLRDLDLEGVFEVLGGDVVVAQQDVPQPLQRGPLSLKRLVEPLLRQLALLDQDVAQTVL